MMKIGDPECLSEVSGDDADLARHQRDNRKDEERPMFRNELLEVPEGEEE